MAKQTSNVTLGALLLDLHSTHCTSTLCLDRLNEVVRAVSPDLLGRSAVQVFRATEWATDQWMLKTVACVVDATDITPELQLVQWSMPCPLSLAVYDTFILHGHMQQVSKERQPPLAGPNVYPVGGNILIHSVDSTHELVVLGDHIRLRYRGISTLCFSALDEP